MGSLIANPLGLLFMLLVAHAVADYALQSDFIALNKARKGPNIVPWYYVMGAHSLIHGGAVSVVTGVWWLGLLEAICHFGIDTLKCEGKITIHHDQMLHVICKAAWMAVVVL